MKKEKSSKERPAPGWRFPLGVALFIIGWCTPLLIPLVTASGLSTGWKTIISGALAVGIPEVFSIAAIAIMGKEGFAYLKARVFGFLKKHGPPDRVGRTRYHIGLVMFVLPLLFGWLGPYVTYRIPEYETFRFWISLAGDVMFVSSLFVLGGDFWDKVRALFIHGARAQLPPK
ncbi:transporter suffix domain-containing protein [Thermodesulfobacteriota bacterium]